MFNKLEARVLSEYKRSRAAPSTFCTLIKHYFSFIKHYIKPPSKTVTDFFHSISNKTKVMLISCYMGWRLLFL
jgi:hypothetical protein